MKKQTPHEITCYTILPIYLIVLVLTSVPAIVYAVRIVKSLLQLNFKNIQTSNLL